MAVNKRFKAASQVTESTYSDAVSGQSKLSKGEHTVRLASVTEVDSDQWHAYDLVWENEAGATFKDRHFITYLDKESGERLIGNNFHKLSLALAGGDMKLGVEYFADVDNGAYIDVDRMQQAIGCTVDIRIGLPRKGHGVRKDGDLMYVFDIESDEIEDEIGGHADFKDLVEAAKEFNIKLSYNRVLVYKVNRDAQEANKLQISTALKTSKSGKSSNTPKVEGF